MRLTLITLYIYLFLSACVAPYEIKSPFQEQLVVEGLITDQPGPYQVMISRSVPIQDQVYVTDWVTGATVIVEDDQGNSETLAEMSPGNYYTKTFQGVIGRSYRATISTTDGSTYQSTFEKLLPVGDFSNLRYEFVQNEEAKYMYEQIQSTNGFNIYLDSDVLPEQSGRVWWRWTGTFEILTYPQFHKKVIPFALVADPLPCSGYIAKGNTLMQVGECTCCSCWVTQYSQVPAISDPRFINENKINHQNVGFIEANVRTFYNKYYLEVEQLSVSQAVYDFWKIIQVQKQNGSNLFQTPPPKTTSNITTTTPNAIPVIGYFSASSVKKHSIMIEQKAVPYPVFTIDTLAISCTQAYKNSTTKKPAFW
jgi:hypothetical protein